jgi:pimeloyl-ACP methyl ester carboxylesterase
MRFWIVLLFGLFPAIAQGTEPLLVIVDGAGDFKGCSTAMCNALISANYPVPIEAFAWSRGPYRIYHDQTNYRYSRAKGKELAERLVQLHRQMPERPLILISHSAGCAVSLAAADHLPPDLLERHILLAPSVSTS